MDEERKKKGLLPYVPRTRTVNSFEVENVSSERAREKPDVDGLDDYEMAGLIAASDDEGDGDADALNIEDFPSIENGVFMCEKMFGVEFCFQFREWQFLSRRRSIYLRRVRVRR